MSQSVRVSVMGQSGAEYIYFANPLGTAFKSVPGNYIFAKLLPNGRYLPLYAGETADLSERFDNHHKMDAVRRNGATHILARQNDRGQEARRREETDICDKWDPCCNG